MTTITTEELTKFRSALQDNDEAMKSLNMVEKCHGNLDEAMEIMMARAGIEPKRGGDYWDNFTKELRNFICDPDFKDFFINDAYALALGFLLAKTTHPAAILILVILYVFRKGISHFCKSEQVA